jgi:maltose alpha-D-glucosyltransferase/alpha-amylase
MFAGQQAGNWKFDEEAEAYYYHTFYDFQPDLNYANPEVLREVRQVMHYWLRLGVSGFRVDALPHIIRNKSSLQKIPQPFEILNKFRQYVEEIKSDAILLGETDVDPSAYSRYFKEEGRFQMLMNFYLANYAFLSLARKEKAPVEFALNMLPQADIFQQYANFLRNHDELDLEQLNESERQQVFDAFAPKENMRIFGRGIRRRLAPMFDNDRRRLELSYSLLFTLQGSPIIRYGDEIGMGDDLSLKGRDSVRTAMQWSDEQNAGFSSASPEDLKVSLIRKGKYGNQKLNVDQQFNDRDSLLQWMMLLCAIRKKCFEFGRGDFNLLDTGHKAVLAHYSRLDKRISLAVHNFSEEEVQVEIKLGDDDVKRLVDVFGDADYDLLKYGSKININPLGYRWFQGVVAKRK